MSDDEYDDKYDLKSDDKYDTDLFLILLAVFVVVGGTLVLAYVF
jgi:hypothetical protein